MDKLTRYQHAVKEVLHFFTHGKYGNKGNLRDVELYDSERNRYAIITTGYDDQVFVHEVNIQLDIVQDGPSIRVVIQANNSDANVDRLLISEGVEEKDILYGEEYANQPA